MNVSNPQRWWENIPPVTRNIILINILVWILEMIMPKFGDSIISMLGLHFWESPKFNPFQLISYMFIHSNSTVMHVLFNMFTLYMFGRMMESVWGSRRFLIFYLICGIGAAIVQEIVWHFTWMHEYIEGIARLNSLSYSQMQSIVHQAVVAGDPEWTDAMVKMKNSLLCVGASGAVFGVLLGFAFVFPNIPMYLFFIPVPVKAKYMVAGYAVLEFFLGISGSGTLVAHFAHLGGMLFALILLLIWKHRGTLGGNRFY